MDSVRPLPANEIRAPLPASSDSPSRVTLWLIAITIIAAAFRFWGLGSKSLWFDEATSFWMARRGFISLWHDLSSPQTSYTVYYVLYMPLYYAFMHFWIGFGGSEFWLRLPSAVCGVATVPLVYGLGSRLFGKRTGLAAAFLLAVQPVHVAYSQEARSYALCLFLSVAGFYFFIRGIQEGSKRWWLLYVVSMVMAVYSHLFAVFLLPSQCAVLLFVPGNKTQFRSAIVSAMMVGLLVAPVFRLAMLKDPGKIPWGIKPNPWDILHALENLIGAGVKFPILVAILAVAGLSFYQTWRESGDANQRWRHALLWGWLVVPITSVVLAAFWKPPLYPRYLLFSLPAVTLLASVGLSRLRSTPRIAAATVVAGALFVPTVCSYYGKPKEDWRGATGYVLAHARPEDGIVFFEAYGQLPYEYYREQMRSTSGAQPVNYPSVVLPGQAAAVYRMPTVWLVVYGVHSNDPGGAEWLANTKTALESKHELASRQHFHEIEILRYTSKTQSDGSEQLQTELGSTAP